jgi:hypothetical protein
MNSVYLTMMFGPAMPILFPICAATLMVLYILEIGMLHYVYRVPPAYDEKLNNRVLKNLAFAPILMLATGFWMYSNPQLLGTRDKNLGTLNTVRSAYDHHHYWTKDLNIVHDFEQGPAGVLAFMCMAYIIYLFVAK